MKKVAVVGAGPAGLFAAYKLSEKFQVDVFEQGKDIESRICSSENRGRCIKCRECSILSGVGGAGLFSDGKLVFDTSIGNNLSELISKEKNRSTVNEVEEIFSRYGIKAMEYDPKKVGELKKKAIQNGIGFIHARQTHIGSDNLLGIMKKIRDDLRNNGVNFLLGKEIKNLNEVEKYDSIMLAPGRSGSIWLEEILRKKSIPFSYRPVDIGVRIEVLKEVTEDVTNVSRDMKFYITTEKYKDRVRTFCVCPEGKVAKEFHEKFALVNGYSNAEQKTENTNFALLVTIPLTNPLINSNTYSNLIAQVFDGLGAGKPILQRYGDIKNGRRSKLENESRHFFKPTLEDVTYGDIALAMPKRYMDDLTESIEKLDKIMPGISGDSTILYAPEIKFHGLRIKTDEYLNAAEKIYVAGDGAGISRGIVGAAASGLLAAEGILKND